MRLRASFNSVSFMGIKPPTMKHLYLLLFFYYWQFCGAQNPDLARTNHWYFGDRAGLDFSSGSPMPDTLGQIGTLERTAAISDLNGNLVAYFGYGSGTTNQWCVWNRNHQPMLNGCGIGPAGVSTPRDGALFIPKPGDDSTYYLFTIDGWENQFQRGLRWHEIDLRLDNGLGSVVNSDQLLYAPVTEQLAATRHANGCDYWVVSHERSSDKFLAYKVTSDGVDSVPVISAAGQDFAVSQQFYNLNGGFNLVFSPTGLWAAQIVSWSLPITGIPYQGQLIRFNNQTGIMYGAFDLPVTNWIQSLFFSPDGSKLYFESEYLLRAGLYQIDINSGVDSVIYQTKTLVFRSRFTLSNDGQTGLDGKVYIVNEIDTSGSILNPNFLSIIENPNILGLTCNIQYAAQPLGSGRATQGLPNFVSSFSSSSIKAPCIYNHIYTQDRHSDFHVSLYPNPTTDKFTLTSFDGFADNTYVFLQDAVGRLWIEQKINFYTKETVLDVSHIPQGLYVVHIQNTKHQKAFKVIIEN